MALSGSIVFAYAILSDHAEIIKLTSTANFDELYSCEEKSGSVFRGQGSGRMCYP